MNHQAELRQVTSQRIDDLSPLANEKITRPEHDRRTLSLRALGLNEPHRRPLNRFADSLGICSIVLLPLHKRLDVAWRDQPGLVTQARNLPRPVVAAAASFHRNQAARLAGEERQHLLSPKLLPEDHGAGRIRAVRLKH